MKSFRKGFTLIELLIVISIVGILASIILASVASSKTKSKQAAFKKEVTSIQPALNISCVDHNITTSDIVGTFKTFNNPAGVVIISGTGNFTCGSSGTGKWNVVFTSNNGANLLADCNQDGCSFSSM